MRRAMLLSALALAVPANASAASLGDLPPLAGKGFSSCVAPTGTPGELVVPVTDGVQFVAATPTGFQRGQTLKLGESFSCSAVATRPGGAGVIVGVALRGLVAAVRDPGGPWGAPVALSGPLGEDFPTEAIARVSDRGDVVVAWINQDDGA